MCCRKTIMLEYLLQARLYSWKIHSDNQVRHSSKYMTFWRDSPDTFKPDHELVGHCSQKKVMAQTCSCIHTHQIVRYYTKQTSPEADFNIFLGTFSRCSITMNYFGFYCNNSAMAEILKVIKIQYIYYASWSHHFLQF